MKEMVEMEVEEEEKKMEERQKKGRQHDCGRRKRGIG
jgi:hypothetical protein